MSEPVQIPNDRYGQSVSTVSTDAARAYYDAVDRYVSLDSTAVEDFGQAVELDPDFALAQLGLALSLAAVGRETESRQAFARAVELRQTQADRLSCREARQIDLITRPDENLTGFYDHLDDHPGDMLVLGFAAGMLSTRRIAAGTGREGVLGLARRTNQSFPDDWAVAGICALELEEAWQFDAAETAAQLALRDRPDNRAAAHGYVHVLHETGRLDPAQSFLDGWFSERDHRSHLQTHLRWHHALIALEDDDVDLGRERYETTVSPQVSGQRTTLVDSASLLWRLRVDGHDDLPWEPVVDLARGHLSMARNALFDVHAALALAVGDRAGLEAMRAAWRAETVLPNRGVVRAVLDGIAAHADGRYDVAAESIGSVTSALALVGGSRLQQDIVVDTLCDALSRSGNPERAANVLADRQRRRQSARDARWIAALRSAAGTEPDERA